MNEMNAERYFISEISLTFYLFHQADEIAIRRSGDRASPLVKHAVTVFVYGAGKGDITDIKTCRNQ